MSGQMPFFRTRAEIQDRGEFVTVPLEDLTSLQRISAILHKPVIFDGSYHVFDGQVDYMADAEIQTR
jgi:hypothetical protein